MGAMGVIHGKQAQEKAGKKSSNVNGIRIFNGSRDYYYERRTFQGEIKELDEPVKDVEIRSGGVGECVEIEIFTWRRHVLN